MRLDNRGAVTAAIFIIALPCAFLLVVAAVSVTFDVPLEWFSRDTTVTLGGHPLTGIQSSIGILVLWAAATTCLFTWAFLRDQRDSNRSFLLWSTMLTALMALDDLFVVHDDLIKRYLGLSEYYAYGLYALLAAIYAIRFRRILLDRSNAFIPIGLGLLAGSVIVDRLYFVLLPGIADTEWRIFIEDGLKLLGIAVWSGGLILYCLRSVGLVSSRP